MPIKINDLRIFINRQINFISCVRSTVHIVLPLMGGILRLILKLLVIPIMTKDIETNIDQNPQAKKPLKSKAKYSLDELVGECDDSADMPSALNEWENAPEVGLEITPFG